MILVHFETWGRPGDVTARMHEVPRRGDRVQLVDGGEAPVTLVVWHPAGSDRYDEPHAVVVLAAPVA